MAALPSASVIVLGSRRSSGVGHSHEAPLASRASRNVTISSKCRKLPQMQTVLVPGSKPGHRPPGPRWKAEPPAGARGGDQGRTRPLPRDPRLSANRGGLPTVVTRAPPQKGKEPYPETSLPLCAGYIETPPNAAGRWEDLA